MLIIKLWMIGLALIAGGGLFMYFGLHGLLVAFLTGMDVLSGRGAIEIDSRGVFKLDHPWRTTLYSLGFTCTSGAAIFLGVMIILVEVGWAPQWWNRFWYRYVIGW